MLEVPGELDGVGNHRNGSRKDLKQHSLQRNLSFGMSTITSGVTLYQDAVDDSKGEAKGQKRRSPASSQMRLDSWFSSLEYSPIDVTRKPTKSNADSARRNLDMYSYRVFSSRRLRDDTGKKSDVDDLHKDIFSDLTEKRREKKAQPESFARRISSLDRTTSSSPMDDMDSDTTQAYSIYDPVTTQNEKRTRETDSLGFRDGGSNTDDDATQPYNADDTIRTLDINRYESTASYQFHARSSDTPSRILPYAYSDCSDQSEIESTYDSPSFGGSLPDFEEEITSLTSRESFDLHPSSKRQRQRANERDASVAYNETACNPVGAALLDPYEDSDTLPYSISDPISSPPANCIAANTMNSSQQSYTRYVHATSQPDIENIKRPKFPDFGDHLSDDVFCSPRSQKGATDLSSFDIASQLSLDFMMENNARTPHHSPAANMCMKKTIPNDNAPVSSQIRDSESLSSAVKDVTKDVDRCEKMQRYMLQRRSYDGSFDEETFNFEHWNRSPTNVSLIQDSDCDEDINGSDEAHHTIRNGAYSVCKRSLSGESFLSMSSWPSVSTSCISFEEEETDTPQAISCRSSSPQSDSPFTLSDDERKQFSLCSGSKGQSLPVDLSKVELPTVKKEFTGDEIIKSFLLQDMNRPETSFKGRRKRRYGLQRPHVHTHVYLDEYLEILRNRTTVPRILPPLEPGQDERLLILPDEDKDESTRNGRTIGAAFYDVREKLAFMDKHGIDISVVSLANPWLDFLPATSETAELACRLNNSMDRLCQDPVTQGRLYGFGALPLSSVDASIEEVAHIAQLGRLRGIIMGTQGCGRGLDDPELIPLFEAIARNDLVIFLHPHYGLQLPAAENVGHSLALALGFPFETTHAIARLILSGIFDRIPTLKILLAHSGGTLPFLAGRIDSCVAHDPVVATRLKHPPSYYLKKLYYDAVIYHSSAIKATADFADPSNMMFGTDHPFFPPLDGGSERWKSVDMNLSAIAETGFSEALQESILGGNALRILNLERPSNE
ncbi:hypothetical protein EC973_008302 [Apophysomyces ossiformis]|uniref:Amidohydrolase-related domain-containing protein n=1 Tax=Apophysomyces ossiformis TaxID=679940 RepID=A0A8H7ETW3_9FUNG|nr:hypothetical protein EC973_008302 [Apophysomyces ossiformis]